LRIERILNQPGDAPSLWLLDPRTDSRVVCFASKKVAYRTVGPKLGENGFAVGFAGVGEGLPGGAWTATTQRLGHRSMDGGEFEGTRIVQRADDKPEPTNKIEVWESTELKITALKTVTGPSGTSTARLENLHLAEPDPSLFEVPADYQVVDAKKAKSGN
jgi:hypothetical protein